MNKPEKIIIHHSWRPEDNTTFNEFEAIRRYYVDQLGWSDVPYHYGIEFVDGKATIQYGRKETETGAHTLGQNNTSIGICVIGNYDTRIPHDDLINLLVDLIKDIYTRWGELQIEPHRLYADKSCPGIMFPLGKVVRLVSESKHWAAKHRDYLIANGVAVHEERYDDTITRGETFALLERVMEVLYESILS